MTRPRALDEVPIAPRSQLRPRLAPRARALEARFVERLNAAAALVSRHHDHLIAQLPDAAGLCTSLATYAGGFCFADLGDAGMEAVPGTSALRLNRASLRRIIDHYDGSPPHVVDQAVLLFAFHETAHLSQGIGDYASVKRLKAIMGDWVIAYLDLRSTTISANLLAHVSLLQRDIIPSETAFRSAFRAYWVDTAHVSLCAFPIYLNMAKCNRFLGHLLTSAFLAAGDRLRVPNWTPQQTLWPQWSINHDSLSVLTNDLSLIWPPTAVEPRMLRSIIEALCNNEVGHAFAATRALVDHLFCEGG